MVKKDVLAVLIFLATALLFFLTQVDPRTVRTEVMEVESVLAGHAGATGGVTETGEGSLPPSGKSRDS